jgi:hypothetical protein
LRDEKDNVQKFTECSFLPDLHLFFIILVSVFFLILKVEQEKLQQKKLKEKCLNLPSPLQFVLKIKVNFSRVGIHKANFVDFRDWINKIAIHSRIFVLDLPTNKDL